MWEEIAMMGMSSCEVRTWIDANHYPISTCSTNICIYILFAPAPNSFFKALDVEHSELCLCGFGLEPRTFHQQLYSELFFHMDDFSLYDAPVDLPFEHLKN